MRFAAVLSVMAVCCSICEVGHALRAVEVTGDAVTVGELLPAAAGDREARETVVLSGLRPGERRVLAPAEIELRLQEAGVAAEARGWKWTESVEVTRRARAITAVELVAAGERAIRSRLQLHPGDEVSIAPVSPPRPLLAPLGPIALRGAARPPALPGGLWVVSVVVETDADANRPGDGTPSETGRRAWGDCVIRFRVQVIGDALVTTRAIKRHELVAEEACAIERREIGSLRGEALREPRELAGQRAARGMAAGAVLTRDLLEPVPVVRRGDIVIAMSRVGRVVGTAEVVAQGEGGIGDVIAARAGLSKSARAGELLVRITGPGKGEVLVQ